MRVRPTAALLLAVGWWTAAAAPTGDGVRNASFEAGLKGWSPLRLAVGSTWSVVEEGARSGKKCIRLDAPPGPRQPSGRVAIRSEPLAILSGSNVVTVSVWVRGSPPGTRVRIRLDHGGGARTFQIGTDWQRISMTGRTHAPSDRLQPDGSVLIALLGHGTVWIDDVQIDSGRTVEPFRSPSSVTVALIPDDPVLVDDKGRRVTFRVTVASADRDTRLRYRVTDYHDRPVAEGRPEGDRIAFTPEEPGWYRLEVRAERGGEVVDTDAVSFVAVRPGSRAAPEAPVRPVAVTISERDLELNLTRLRRLGIVDARVIGALDWRRTEPRRGQWRWSDPVIDLLAARGIRPLITLEGTPGWAVEGKVDIKRHYPALESQWRRYVAACAGRYADRVEAWEVRNEPNLLPGHVSIDTERVREYAVWVRAASEAIRAVDPDAHVAAPATAQRGGAGMTDFERLLAASAAWVDVASVHPYRKGFRRGPEETHLGRDLERLRSVADRYLGKGAPLWATEMGWTARGGEPSVFRQTRYMARAAPMFLSGGVERVYWFHLAATSEWSSRVSGDMGLLDPGPFLAPRRAVAVLATLADQFAGVRGGGPVDAGVSGVWLYRLDAPGGETLVVAWTTKADQGYALEVGDADVRVYDVMNRRVKSKVRGRRVSLDLTRDPLFVRIAPSRASR